MTKYNKIVSLFLLLLLVTATSCDKDFEEINKNPNQPTAVQSGLLLADLQFRGMNRMYSTFVGGDMGSCWSQQWSKVQYNDEERYSPRSTVIQSVWDDLYEDVASDSKKMYDLAVAEENPNMQGVALVMQAWAFSVLTDVFGEIPFDEALKAEEGIFTPIYNTQDQVFAGILQMLTDADQLLDTEGTILASSDIVYAGDAAKWKMFANSLKFRVLMRMSSASGANVSADLQALIDADNMFQTYDDWAVFHYLDADPNANPIFETIVFGTRGEFKVSDVLVNMLQTASDPRLPVYAGLNDGGIYRGKPAGIADVPSDDYNYNNVSPIGDFYLSATLPGVYMSFSELQFLKAEAAVRGLISGGTGMAQTYFQSGIDASMLENGLAAGSFTQNLSATTSVALEQIGNQKWLALFCQGVEAWTEQRRTGFPVLSPAIDGVISEIPSRYTYPNGEQSLNGTNYTEAVSRQGADLLTTKVWWNK